MNLKLSPEELAKQLKNPHGKLGKEVADRMNHSNKPITEFTYSCMSLKPNDKLLEIGFGNGKLLQFLFQKEPNLYVAGIDISDTMVDEAARFNQNLIAAEKMELKVAGVSNIPYPDDHFDCVCSINTIYFWPSPEQDIKSIFNVLKQDGKCFISLTPKEEIQELEAAQFGFRLYEKEELEDLFSSGGFSKIEMHKKAEPPILIDGNQKVFHSLVFELKK